MYKKAESNKNNVILKFIRPQQFIIYLVISPFQMVFFPMKPEMYLSPMLSIVKSNELLFIY